MFFRLIFYIQVVIVFSSCNHSDENTKGGLELKEKSLLYAKRFVIKECKDFKVLQLLGNKNNYDVTSTFVLYKNIKPDYTSKNTFYIKVPVKKVASMSSVYTSMIEELNELNKIVAIDNVDYYTNTKVRNGVDKKEIIEISKGPILELEKTIALKPDLLLTFGMGNPVNDVDKKIVQANIPVAVSLDHLEETPLARAEWLKFIACFFDKEALSDSLFFETEKRYNQLTELTKVNLKKVSVLTEVKYGDAWYVPSGKSYIANLLADAGALYFWNDDQESGSKPLSFEAVYAKAKNCDYWINLYNINSKSELLSYDERYKLFKAFSENHLYNNNRTTNEKGYSNYWETGISHPDELLADLIFVFYPTLLPKHELKYYKHINK